jgi:hypothetical protein
MSIDALGRDTRKTLFPERLVDGVWALAAPDSYLDALLQPAAHLARRSLLALARKRLCGLGAIGAVFAAVALSSLLTVEREKRTAAAMSFCVCPALCMAAMTTRSSSVSRLGVFKNAFLK